MKQQSWMAKAKYTDLLDLLGRRGPTHLMIQQSPSMLPPIRHETIIMLWKMNPTGSPPDEPSLFNGEKRIRITFPSVIVVANNQRREFLAWCATYIKQIRPFTSYCRVFESNEIDDFNALIEEPHLGLLDNVALGLIIGEAITHGEGEIELSKASPAIFKRTLSYSLARGIALGLGPWELEEIASKWHYLSEITKQPPVQLSFNDILTPWKVALTGVSHPHGHVKSIFQRWFVKEDKELYKLYQAFAQGKNSFSAFVELSNSTDLQLGLFRNKSDSPREDRVAEFEMIADRLRDKRIKEPLCSFLVGLAASQIAPGTMDHWRLVATRIRDYPTALLWYGCCAGVRAEAAILGLGDGLGHRIEREILRCEEFFNRPTADLSISELEILSDELGTVRGSVSGHLEVELISHVTTFVGWPPRSVSDTSNEPTSTAERQTAKALAAKLHHSLARADDIVRELSNVLEGRRRTVNRRDRKN